VQAEQKYAGQQAYNASKLANVVFTVLQRSFIQGMTVSALCD